MEVLTHIVEAVLSVPLPRVLLSAAIFVALGFAWSWYAWWHDRLDNLAMNVAGLHGLATVALWVLSVVFISRQEGIRYGLTVGLLWGVGIAFVLGWAFRGALTAVLWIGLDLAQLFKVPQPRSIFKDPEALKAITKFLKDTQQDR